MKILQVVPTYYPAVRYGGPIWSVHGLSRALAEQGQDVHVYTTNRDGNGILPIPAGQPVHLDGVTVQYFATGLGRRLYRSPEMRKALQVNIASFDIVHLHSVFLWPTLMAARAARDAGVPYVLSPRGMLVGDLIRLKSPSAKRAWIFLFERHNIEGAAAIHLTSDIEAAELRALGFRSSSLSVIPNGIDLPGNELINRKPSAFCDAEIHRPYILFLGRLNWKKGLDRLIPAMKVLKCVDLLIAGYDEENYTPELKELAHCCGVIDRVRFLGPVHGEKKWALLSSAEILVLPSYSENFGNVVLEAMAARCPVIVTPEVGLSSVVQEVGCGVVVPGDSENLGLEIRRLLEDHERRINMGNVGRQIAETKYSWRMISKQMLDTYSGALASRSAARSLARHTRL